MKLPEKLEAIGKYFWSHNQSVNSTFNFQDVTGFPALMLL